jgi:putative transcriptional regulator
VAKRTPGRPPKSGSTPVVNRIRELRFLQGEMTQQQLADAVGVSRQTIVATEQSKYAPSLELAFRIARAFGVPLEEVFSFVDPADKTPAPSKPGNSA